MRHNFGQIRSIFLLIFLGLISCEKSIKNNEYNESEGVFYLKINLKDNIKSQIPSVHGNTAEKFLNTQLYEPLISKNFLENSSNSLVKSYFFDSTKNAYIFSLNINKKFSNGNSFSVEEVYQLFKRIFDDENSEKDVNEFKSKIEGYKKYNFLRVNNYINDSVPSGLELFNSHQFSLRFIDDYNPIPFLSSEYCYVYHQDKNQKYFGSGPFMIENSNEDIYLNLKRNPFYEFKNSLEGESKTIDGLSIRFIKNDNAIINEFLNGSIDVLNLNSIDQKYEQLESLNNDKYGHKNSIKQSRANVDFLSFHNISNTDLITLILSNLSEHHHSKFARKNIVQDSIEVIDFSREDSIKNYLKEIDSIEYQHIPILVSSNSNLVKKVEALNNKLSPKIQLDIKDSIDFNLNAEYIVLEQKNVEWRQKQINRQIFDNLLRREQLHNQSIAIGIIAYQHEMIIFDERIKGFSVFGNWYDDINRLSYSKPKVY